MSYRYRDSKGKGLRSLRFSQRLTARDLPTDINEILQGIATKSTSQERKLDCLNAFVKLQQVGTAGNGNYSREQLCYCLRVCLIDEVVEVRSAGFRALRYLVKTDDDTAAVVKTQIPIFIVRSLDVMLDNALERTQALRLARQLLITNPDIFPLPIARALVSLSRDGGEENDKFYRCSLGVLCEFGILNPKMFIECGGVRTVIFNILNCSHPRMSESLVGTLLFLMNHPDLRRMAAVDLPALTAPFTDRNYKHFGTEKDDQAHYYMCSTLALLTVFRSWTGVLHFCFSGNSTLKSLVDLLWLDELVVRKLVLDIFYEVLQIPLPNWTDEYKVALQASDPSNMRDAWKLSEGFVAAEGSTILPPLECYRPNLVVNHLALLAHTFVHAGLLDSLVEVVVTNDAFLSIRATILLGEILHMVHTLIPQECSNVSHCLPSLMAYASSSNRTAHCRALEAVTALIRLHELKKRGPVPASLFLNQQLQFCSTFKGESCINQRLSKTKLKQWLKTSSVDFHHCIKNTLVLVHKDYLKWDWYLISRVLQWPMHSLKKADDTLMHNFLTRLMQFFKPSNSCGFSKVEISNHLSEIYCLVGCQMLNILLESDDVGISILDELLIDIMYHLSQIQASATVHNCLFSPANLNNTLCQHYFLFLGRLTHTTRGLAALDRSGIVQELLNVVGETSCDYYVKLIISSQDYGIDSAARILLSKALTVPYESARLYATRFLRVLIRASVPKFEKWGIELLVTQVYDQSKAVSLVALEILEEACAKQTYMEAVIALRPSLLHLGDKGLLLIITFGSLPSGFQFLHSAKFLENEVEHWNNTFNEQYVRIVEVAINDAFSHYQRSEDGKYILRTSGDRPIARDICVPPHLYSQLAFHQEGLDMLLRHAQVEELCDVINAGKCASEKDILQLKAAIWAIGHMASTTLGLTYLINKMTIGLIVQITENCPVLSVRWAGFCSLCLIATTPEGTTLLKKYHWHSIRRSMSDKWSIMDTWFDNVEDLIENEIVTTEIASHCSGDADSHLQLQIDVPDIVETPVSDHNISSDCLSASLSESSFGSPGNHSYIKEEGEPSSVTSMPTRRTPEFNTEIVHLRSPRKKTGRQSLESLPTDLERSFGYATLRSLGRVRRSLLMNFDTTGDLFTSYDWKATHPHSSDVKSNLLPLDFLQKNHLARVESSSSIRSVQSVKMKETELYLGLCLPQNITQLSVDDIPSAAPNPSGECHFPAFGPSEQDSFEFHTASNCLSCSNLHKHSRSSSESDAKACVKHPLPSIIPHARSLRAESDVTDSSSISSVGSVDVGTTTPDDPKVITKPMLRREVLRLVSKLQCLVSAKTSEQGLLRLKEKFPVAFQDVCLYTEICGLMCAYPFHLSSRRFLQELYLDLELDELYEGASVVLESAKAVPVNHHGESS